ncbi:hypothetical protein [Halothece sp. PCC 7418]|nr:hypothetical protein [Halothece sp. PCC 7418]
MSVDGCYWLMIIADLESHQKTKIMTRAIALKKLLNQAFFCF